MFNHHDINRNECMLRGPLAHLGYDWWWHSFTAQDAETGEEHFQLHRFFGWKNVHLHPAAPFKIKAEECIASENRLKGAISISPEEASSHPEWMCDVGDMYWDLCIDKQIAFNVGYGASKVFRDLGSICNVLACGGHEECI